MLDAGFRILDSWYKPGTSATPCDYAMDLLYDLKSQGAPRFAAGWILKGIWGREHNTWSGKDF